MTLLDDWPSLAPIRTSSRDSRVCCETLSLHDPPPPSPDHPSLDSFPQTSEKLFVAHTYDRLPSLKSADVRLSTPAPSSMAKASSTGRHFFSYFHPSRTASLKLSKPVLSPRRGSSDCGGFFRSIASFSGPVHHSGPITHSAVISRACPIKLGAGQTFVHSKMLKGYCASNKGHTAKIIPPHMLNRKTGLGYESDLPTSPEVTCMGRVRRKKHRNSLEAVVRPSNLGMKKGKKVDAEGLLKVDVMESPGRDKERESPREGNASRWRPVLGVREISESQNTADMNRRSNFENLRVDLGRFSSAFELSSGVRDIDDAPRSPHEFLVEESNLVYSDKTDRFTLSEECIFDSTDKEGRCSLTVPPPNCLLMMRNAGRSRGSHIYDEICSGPPISLFTTEEQAVGKRHTDASIWKRMGMSERSRGDLKERLKLEQQKPYTR